LRGRVWLRSLHAIDDGFGEGNSVSGNFYTPKDTVACGLLFIDANGVKQQSNSFVDNEMNLCNVGRGGGNTNA
jgi:hypothetical protein